MFYLVNYIYIVMKKVKLIKSIAISAPVLITPLIANSCSSKDNKNSNAKYYVDALAKTLKTQLDTITNQVNAAAKGNNTLDITSQIKTAVAKAKAAVSVNSNYIDRITLAFQGTGNLKVVKNSENKYILTVYPSFVTANSNEQTLTTTLSLTLSDSNKNKQSITNTYDITKRFKNYTADLGDSIVNSVYASADGNTIFAGTDNAGVAVGTKNSESSYTFQNYTTGLGNNTVNSVNASADGNTIYAGTTGGVSVGTKNNSTYTFQNYTTGLGNNTVNSVNASADGNTIYAGTEGGVSVGTKNSESSYTFQNYTTGLGSNTVNSVYASSNGNTIYAGTEGGVSVGTKNNSTYTFQNYTTGLGSNTVNSVNASADGNTIYAGTEGGVSVGTKNSEGSYTFQNYTTGLGSNTVNSVYASSNGNTIYVGTGYVTAGGVATGGFGVGTKQSDDSFTFENYGVGLGSITVYSVYASSNGNTIYAGTENGFSIASSNWLAQNNLNYAINNYQAIALSNKNDN